MNIEELNKIINTARKTDENEVILNCAKNLLKQIDFQKEHPEMLVEKDIEELSFVVYAVLERMGKLSLLDADNLGFIFLIDTLFKQGYMKGWTAGKGVKDA
jgi:hypothetical protein